MNPQDELVRLVDRNNASIRRMEAFAPALCQWFDSELMAVSSQLPQATGGILMGAPVWGQAYIERMLLYSLPTLGSPKNLEALSGKCSFVFYSTPGDRPILWQATRWMRQAGIHTVWRDIPQELLEMLTHPESKYGVLSACQNALTHMAGHAGAGFHMYMPDHAYSDGYFHSLARLGAKYPAIVQQTVSVDIEAAKPELEFCRRDGSALVIPAKQLGAIALRHMHARSNGHIMNKGRIPDQMPDSRQAIWIGKDSIAIADCCRNLMWLAPELCMDAPIAFTSTLDMLAPEYIPPGTWYEPSADDDMVHVELSAGRHKEPRGYVSSERFILRCWAQVSYTEDYMEYMERLSRLPIPEQTDYLSEEEIERQHQWILNAMREGKTRAMEAYFARQHPSRWT